MLEMLKELQEERRKSGEKWKRSVFPIITRNGVSFDIVHGEESLGEG